MQSLLAFNFFFLTMRMNSPAKTIQNDIHKQPIEKNGEYEKKCTPSAAEGNYVTNQRIGKQLKDFPQEEIN